MITHVIGLQATLPLVSIGANSIDARLTEMLGRDSGYVQKIVRLHAAFDAHVVAPAARSTQRLVRASHLDILTNFTTVSHPCRWRSDRITPKEQLRLLFLLV